MEIQNVLFPFFPPLFVMRGGLFYVEIRKTKELHTYSVFWYESQGLGAERCLFGHSPVRVQDVEHSQRCQCCKGTKPPPAPRFTEPLNLIILL